MSGLAGWDGEGTAGGALSDTNAWEDGGGLRQDPKSEIRRPGDRRWSSRLGCPLLGGRGEERAGRRRLWVRGLVSARLDGTSRAASDSNVDEGFRFNLYQPWLPWIKGDQLQSGAGALPWLRAHYL